MDTVSIAEVKRSISTIVNRVAFGRERIILTSRGRPKAALVSIDDLQKLETLETTSSPPSRAQRKAALGIAASPLAMPIMAGPGTIATAMNFASAPGRGEVIITVITFGLLCLLTYGMFVRGEKITKFLGPSVIDVITKMMGLILAVIGMQMLIEGVQQAIKSFS